WSRRSPGSGMPLPTPDSRYAPGYVVGEKWIRVSTATGQGRLLNVVDGTVGTKDAPDGWVRSPCRVNDDTVCAVLDVRRVALCSRTGRNGVHTPTGAPPLSGGAPQVVAGPGRLIGVIGTNLGYRVNRLDVGTGKALWARPPLLRAHGVDAN